jgi:predicted small secreted protein
VRERLLLVVALVAALTPACNVTRGSGQHLVVAGALPPRTVSTSPAAPAATPAARLVRWHGQVEQLFVHPLVLEPGLAFTADPLGRGFADYFVTAVEFRRILDQLWRNGWTLVSPLAVASKRVFVPPGRKPLVLQEDDVNYYGYFHNRGLAGRLVVGPTGHVMAEHVDAAGQHLTDQDVVPLVDAEVARHPLFSVGGAKGLLALTGYEGLFGEHDLTDSAVRDRVRALASALRADGWVLASHTYGHINLSVDSLAVIQRDTTRWRALTKGLLGPVHVLVYPFGARPTEAGRALLRDAGFTVQYDIDVRPLRWVDEGVVMMSRRHVDGFAFEDPTTMAPFFDVASVRDARRPI